MLNFGNSLFHSPLGAKIIFFLFIQGLCFQFLTCNLVNRAQYNILIQPNPSERLFHVK